MIYQLAPAKRLELVNTIKSVSEGFSSRNPDANVPVWLNQGMPPEDILTSDFRFDRIFVSEFGFRKGRLFGRKLAALKDDLATSWTEISDQWEPISKSAL